MTLSFDSVAVKCAISEFVLLFMIVLFFMYLCVLLFPWFWACTVTFHSVTRMSICFHLESTVMYISVNCKSFCWNFSSPLLVAVCPQVTSGRAHMSKNWVFAYWKPFVYSLIPKGDCLVRHKMIESHFFFNSVFLLKYSWY